MKELFIFDLDGTALTHEKIISPSTKEAIKIIKENNGQVAVATGRIHMTCLEYAEQMGISYLIETNGTKVSNIKDGTVIFEEHMDRKLINLLINFLEEFAHGTIIYTKEAIIIIGMNKEKTNKKIISAYETFLTQGKNYFYFKDVEEFNKSDLTNRLDQVCKIITVSNAKEKGSLYDELESVFDKKLNISSGNTNELEINSVSHSKWNAIKILKEKLECDKVISFGDGYNDIAMLKNSDVGVAMGNAFEEIKMFADEVTDSNSEEGIFNFIKKYYKIK